VVSAKKGQSGRSIRWRGEGWIAIVTLGCVACLVCASHAGGQAFTTTAAQKPLPKGTPQSWADAAAQHELAILRDDSRPLRYSTRKVNEKNDTTRVVIESEQGNVARLVERDGHPLTAAEDTAERSRLNDILSSPEAYLKHEKKGDAGKDYTAQLLRLMPHAMIFSYAPGQPQPAGATAPQIVLDFQPDPAFHPPTMVSEVLTGLAGRVWIDARTGVMTRIEGKVLRPVNFGWGIIAKVYPGGTVEFEQASIDGKRWAYTHVAEHATLREMMVRISSEKVEMTAWGFNVLPRPMPFQEAVHALLAMPVHTQ
jgi:hypothetical protein